MAKPTDSFTVKINGKTIKPMASIEIELDGFKYMLAPINGEPGVLYVMAMDSKIAIIPSAANTFYFRGAK